MPPALRAFAFVSAPADTFANICPPSLARFPPASESERIPSLVPFPSTSFLGPSRTEPRSQTHVHTRRHPPHPHTIDAALHRAPCGPRPHPPVKRVGCAGPYSRVAHTPPPCGLPAAACSPTASTTRPSRPSKTLPAAASTLPSKKRPRSATPPPRWWSAACLLGSVARRLCIFFAFITGCPVTMLHTY